MDLGISGLASGFDWRTLVDQLADVERLPQRRLLVEQNRLGERLNAYGSIKTDLSVLANRLDALKEPSLFQSRSASVSDSTVASATAQSGAALGAYKITVSQLATASKQNGAANVGAPLNPTNDVSGLTLSSAGFSTPITAGTFTVNGKVIEIATSNTLQDVFDAISTATGGSVTGSYDSASDSITLSSAGEIVLGSSADSSNFLTAARLHNNGTGAVTSSSSLGGIRTSATLDSALFQTPITDGGSGAGMFKINGVEISFDAAADSVDTVLQRINSSAAGVSASYDATNDRFVLTNKSTGDLGVALEDVTGNFLSATGLLGGTLSRGRDLLFSVNDGGTLVSHSNTITEATSGLAGLSIAVAATGTTTVTVDSDTEKVKTAINDFLSAYNQVQSLIDAKTASSTDADGKVTAGVLAGDQEANEIASRLRSLAFSHVSGLSGTLSHLSQLGIQSNGTDDKLSLSDSALLDQFLESDLASVEKLFTDESSGLAVNLSNYVAALVGDEGSLNTRTDNLTEQSAQIDVQISDLERTVQSNRERLINSFIAMETAQAKINQQMQFLAQRFASPQS